MKMILLPILFLLGACQMKATENSKAAPDEFVWLEEVEGTKALGFAKAENEATLEHFKKNPLFKTIEQEVRQIALAKDRLPGIRIQNGVLYNFWQDEVHVRGLWRRTSLAEFKKQSPQWEILLDFICLKSCARAVAN